MKDSSAKHYPTSLGSPIDQVAKRVTSKGFQYTPNKKQNGEIWDAPPPVELMPSSQKKQNLIGSRQYKMQIVGFYKTYEQPNGDKKFLWLARCDCGKYETRDGSVWRKMRAFKAQCQLCEHAWFLKHRHLTNEERDKLLAQMRENHERMMAKVHQELPPKSLDYV